MNPFGKNITILRGAFGRTQSELGKEVEASKSQISRYEAGADVPKYQAELIAKYFGCTASDLETREISIEEAQSLAARAKEKKKYKSEQESLVSDDEGGYQYKRRDGEPEPSEPVDVQLAVHVGRVIDEILTRHQAPRAAYAKRILKRNERTLQRVIKGEIMATLPLAIKIASDFGESLDVFRPGPLPKGHMLRTIADQERVITAQAELIAALRK